MRRCVSVLCVSELYKDYDGREYYPEFPGAARLFFLNDHKIQDTCTVILFQVCLSVELALSRFPCITSSYVTISNLKKDTWTSVR